MPLISNSSTLILLGKIELLRIWVDHTKKIIIPEEVYQETVLHKKEYDSLIIKRLVEEKKITIEKAPKDRIHKSMNDFHLDLGEAAAYALFNPQYHTALMTDDGELIKLCKLEEIPFLSSMAIVIALYHKKYLNKTQAKEKIIQLHKIGRYSKEIYQYFISTIEGD